MNQKQKRRTRSRRSISIPLNLIKKQISAESDLIVHSIIEKLISLTISTSLRNRVEKNISNKCFSYMEEFLANKLIIEFLPHDIDDTHNNKNPNELSMYSNKFGLHNSSQDINNENSYIINNNKDFTLSDNNDNNNNNNNNNSSFSLQNIFFNNNNDGENCWDFIEEPKSNKYDSYSSTMVKFIQMERQEVLVNKKGMQIDYNLEEVKEEESFSKSNLKTHIDNNNNNNNTNNNEEVKRNGNIKKSLNKVIRRSSLLNNNPPPKKKKMNDINQFPYEDIENDDYYHVENNDEIDYSKLRKELVEFEAAKMKEEKKKNKKNKSIDIKQLIMGSNTRQYIGKNVTVDPNGEIVHIKSIGLNKLKSEFKCPKTILKNVKMPKKNAKKEKKEKKETTEKEGGEEKTENNKENIIKNEMESSDTNKQKDMNNIFDQFKTVSRGSNNVLPKISKKKSNLSIEPGGSEKKKKREPFYPSGSNFHLMNLEIGVSIKEDEKFKTGGRDFFKKFNKYSKDIYNEKLKESIAANSFLNTKTQVFGDESNKFKTETNFEHTYAGFNMTMNQPDNSIQKEINNSKYLMTSTNNFGNYNYISNISNLIGSTSNNNNNIMTKTLTHHKDQSNLLNPSIRLSNISSLIGSMDKLTLITEREERNTKKIANNIFKRQRLKNMRKLFMNDYNEMDDFTKQILKTDFTSRAMNVSEGKYKHSHGRNPEKPSILELTREIGYKNRPYRNRSKITPSFVNPVMKTVAFFKQ